MRQFGFNHLGFLIHTVSKIICLLLTHSGHQILFTANHSAIN